MSAPAVEQLAAVDPEHMALARRVAALELLGRGPEQHQVWTRLENALRPTGARWIVGFDAAADLVAIARAEQVSRGERPAPMHGPERAPAVTHG